MKPNSVALSRTALSCVTITMVCGSSVAVVGVRVERAGNDDGIGAPFVAVEVEELSVFGRHGLHDFNQSLQY